MRLTLYTFYRASPGEMGCRGQMGLAYRLGGVGTMTLKLRVQGADIERWEKICSIVGLLWVPEGLLKRETNVWNISKGVSLVEWEEEQMWPDLPEPRQEARDHQTAQKKRMKLGQSGKCGGQGQNDAGVCHYGRACSAQVTVTLLSETRGN